MWFLTGLPLELQNARVLSGVDLQVHPATMTLCSDSNVELRLCNFGLVTSVNEQGELCLNSFPGLLCIRSKRQPMLCTRPKLSQVSQSLPASMRDWNDLAVWKDSYAPADNDPATGATRRLTILAYFNEPRAFQIFPSKRHDVPHEFPDVSAICSHLGLAPWLWWRAPHPRIRRATTGSTAFPSAGAKGRSSQVHPKLSADAPSLHTLYCLISNIIYILHIWLIWHTYKIWSWNCTNWLCCHTHVLFFPSCHCLSLLWFLACHLAWDLVGWYRGHLR